MSYFSHNPEKWDEIQDRSLARWMQSKGCPWETEDILEWISEHLVEEDHYDRLIRSVPLDIIADAEQDFWSDLADGYQ